jgi:hypothetical protein
MAVSQAESLSVLYEQDETAWLEAMAELLAQPRYGDLDHYHLREYLAEMAKRDRREVFSRLVVLMNHLLKWEHQPQKRSGSWRGTMRAQRRELRQLLESGTLKRHAEAVLHDAYNEARKQAADETELALETFPSECDWDLERLLSEE